MSFKFSSKVAFRYFFAKKNEFLVSFISKFSLIGVTIGVAALIVVMAVMNGFREELAKNIIGLNSDITISSYGRYIKNPNQLMKKIRSHSYIENVTPVISGQGLAVSHTNSLGIMIKAFKLSDLSKKHQIAENIVRGSLSSLDSKHNIVIGSELAANLGVTVGDKLKLVSAQMISTAFGSVPRTKDFTVSGVFSSGMYDFDMATILMNREAALSFLSLKDINILEVTTNDPESASALARLLYDSLEEEINITSWQVQFGQFFNALKVERVTMMTILSLIILVAAFNIISSLFILVKDKSHDIAILKTMGASRNDIMIIFMINGLMIGLIGTFLGILLGLGFAYNIDSLRQFIEKVTGVHFFEAALYFLYHLPVKVEMSYVLITSFISITLCFLATIYPSYRAAKLDPVEAMRYE